MDFPRSPVGLARRSHPESRRDSRVKPWNARTLQFEYEINEVELPNETLACLRCACTKRLQRLVLDVQRKGLHPIRLEPPSALRYANLDTVLNQEGSTG